MNGQSQFSLIIIYHSPKLGLRYLKDLLRVDVGFEVDKFYKDKYSSVTM